MTQEAISSSCNTSDPLPDLNFPLPEERGPACLVKVTVKSNQHRLLVAILHVSLQKY